IRSCLKQPEFAPVSVPAQIAILLALSEKLFDPVPLEQMTDAEHAVHEAAANIPAEVGARFETADKLSDEDRKTIVDIARKALAGFQPKPESKPKPESRPGSESKPESKPKPEGKAESKPEGEAEPKRRPKPKPKPEDESKPAATTPI
ncbi:MAG: hypothetical protein ACTS6J_23700, partial [Burkholderiales bacterium]